MSDEQTKPGVKRRGFASMTPERRREVAAKGARTAHERGTAHEFTPDEAREAGRKGGAIVSADREHMAEIARHADRKDRVKAANIRWAKWRKAHPHYRKQHTKRGHNAQGTQNPRRTDRGTEPD